MAKTEREKDRTHPSLGQRAWQRCMLLLLNKMTRTVRRQSRTKALRLGQNLGRLAYRLARRQRNFAKSNLRLAFDNQMTAAEQEVLIRHVFEHFGKTIVELLRAPLLDAQTVESLVTIEGWEHVEAALAEGRGIIFVTAHIGNWTVMGPWLAARGIKLTQVAREPTYPPFRAFMYEICEAMCCKIMDKSVFARELVRRLNRGETVVILPDQNSQDMFVPFFDVPAGTVAGPASLALAAGAPLLPGYCIREKDDSYRCVFLEPIPVENTGSHKADVKRIMTEVNRVMETCIRLHPEQWLWIHDRWRSAFKERFRAQWPEGYDFDAALARRKGDPPKEGSEVLSGMFIERYRETTDRLQR